MSKVTNGYKRQHGLTIDQLNAIDLLVIGKTDKEVAGIVGINRVTVTKWRNYDLDFQAELNKKRKEIWSSSIDRLRALVPLAIERLEQEIENTHGWKVALEVIKIAGIESQHVKNTGHETSEKILNELAESRATQDLFSNTSDYTKQKILKELQEKLNKIETS